MAECLHSLLPDGRDGSTQKRGMCPVKIASTFGRLVSWLLHGACWVMGNSAAPVSMKTKLSRAARCAATVQRPCRMEESALKRTSEGDSSSPSTNLYRSPSELIITVTLFGITWVQTKGGSDLLLSDTVKSDTISLVDATLGISYLTALHVKLGEKHFLWASQK